MDRLQRVCQLVECAFVPRPQSIGNRRDEGRRCLEQNVDFGIEDAPQRTDFHLTKQTISVASPWLGENEKRYVQDALDDGAISGYFGRHLGRFESEFARFCDCEHGVSASNGTTALHLAVAALGIGAGDEVLVSTTTNMATFFAVLYQGAKPIPIDIEPDTFNLDPRQLERQITERTRAILVVHLFGHPVDMDPVLEIARRHKLFVIEDCAQAHGATYKGRKVGGLGDVGCFSFYANKILTTGEGGMLTLHDKALALKAASLKSLAFGERNKFMHQGIGFNYRLPNLQAAIGCAQLERIDEVIARKRALAGFYSEALAGVPGLQLPVEKPYAKNVYWMYHVGLTGPASGRRADIMARLKEDGVETREGFIPFNMQEVFLAQGIVQKDACPVANEAAERTFYLPSSPLITRDEQRYVVERLKTALGVA